MNILNADALREQLRVDLQPVSVIIVNYNAGPLLIECVSSALAQAAQVIVIDNASSDSSMAMLAAEFKAEPRLLFQYTTKNLGFAAGCNLGLGLATQENLLFLNPDCILGIGTLMRMLEVLVSDPRVGMVGGRLTNLDGSEQGGGRRAVPTPWRSFVRAFGLSWLASRWPRLFYDFHLHKQPLPLEPIEVEAISGALMLVSRAAMIDVGAWDEAYFLHCEDLDWCMRFRKRGWKILFVPDAPVLHYQGHSSRSKPIFVEWHKHKGMVRFYRKFFRHQYPGGMMMLVNTGVWLRFGAVVAYHTAKNINGKVKDLRGKEKNKRGINQLERRLKSHKRRSRIENPGAAADQERRKKAPDRRRRSLELAVALPDNISYTGLIGPSSFVGTSIIPMLIRTDRHVMAYSRKTAAYQSKAGVTWLQLAKAAIYPHSPQIKEWLYVAPIWSLPQYFPMLETYGARRIVALSSTSRFTKIDSTNAAESDLAMRLVDAEQKLIAWAEANDIEWIILRPTLIYGLGLDKNVSEIVRFIRRASFFPVFGKAQGLRQPVHVEDLAQACLAALTSHASNKAYNISGGETLSYRDMVVRIFEALGRKPRLLSVSLFLFGIAISFMRFLPRYRNWTAAMAERMNQDLVFDHTEAEKDLGFKPRPFVLSEADLSQK